MTFNLNPQTGFIFRNREYSGCISVEVANFCLPVLLRQWFHALALSAPSYCFNPLSPWQAFHDRPGGALPPPAQTRVPTPCQRDCLRRNETPRPAHSVPGPRTGEVRPLLQNLCSSSPSPSPLSSLSLSTPSPGSLLGLNSPVAQASTRR